MRRVLKNAIEMVACGTGLPYLARRRKRGNALILAYHNIVPDGEQVAGDASLHMSQRAFADQLDVLRETHDVIALREAIAPARASARPRAVITFDDATQGAMTAGVAELARRGMPATVFVAPAFVGGRSFWWDALRDLSRSVRDHCLTALQGRDELVREWAVEHGIGLREVPAHQSCATEAQLREAEAAGIEFGSHTWSHPNLSMLNSADVESELKPPLDWLNSRFSAVLPWLAYPYGLSAPEVGAAARSAGYEAALRVDGGWLGAAAQDRYVLPRQNVPAGISPRGFRLLSSGARRSR